MTDDAYFVQSLVVIQDMLRVFVIRIAYQKAENCSVLLRPVLSWISDHVSDSCSLSEMDTYKVKFSFCCSNSFI